MAGAPAPRSRSMQAAKKRKLRTRGSGGIKEKRPGVFLVDIEFGSDPVTGRRRRVSRTVRGTVDDAEAALAKLKVAEHEGRLRRPGTRARTVRAALEAYLDDAETGVIEMAPKTVVTARSAISTMCETRIEDGRVFGNILLSTLGWQDIEGLYRSMREAGQVASTVRRKATVLASGLDHARKHGLLEYNPARDASRPKLVRTKPHSPAKSEVTSVLAAAAEADAEIADAALILATTGMRMGELLGLQLAEVDLDGEQVHLAWAISDGGKGVGIVRKPTKRSDWRDGPLTKAALAAFERQTARCRTRFDVDTDPTHYVFPGSRGPDIPHRPDTFGDRWAAARGTTGTTFLHLRHFVATTMLDAGEEYRTVANVLGNSETTLRLHYDGRTNIDKRRAVSALEFD
jgi:integrase